MKKVQRLVSGILAIVLVISSISAMSVNVIAATDSGTCGSNLIWSFDSSSGILTISGKGDMKDYDPSYLTGYPAPWRSFCKDIQTVIIKSGVTSIGKSAFYSCSNLTNVVIPYGIGTIGNYAFDDCRYLDSIELPNCIVEIGVGAFRGTQYYNNPDNWENDVLYIGNYLIKANETIAGSYEVKSGTLAIANSAFASCASLTDLKMPDSVVNIGSGTFASCDSLESILLSKNIKFIGYSTFSNCKSLVNVVIPEGVTLIENRAFYNCSNLTEITIPKSMVNIGDSAFSYCVNLDTIHYSGTKMDWLKLKIGESNESLIYANLDCHTHSYNPKITSNPTYVSTGIRTYICSCGEILKTEQIAKLALGKVSGLKAKSVKVSKSSSISLAWNPVSGAEKYEVYQQNGKKWKKVGTTSNTKLTVKKLKSNKSYKFKVRAVVDDTEGAYSTVLTVKTIPETISKLTLKAGKKQLAASWKKVSDISGYEVQYSTSKKFTKKTTKTVNVKKSSKKTTIKSLKKGKKYYVRVRTYKTVNGKKVYSSWAKVKSAKAK